MSKSLEKQHWKLLVVVGLLVLGLVMVAQVVKVNLDNRSKADEVNTVNSVSSSEAVVTDGVCGEADGGFGVSSRPISGLCDSGSVVWTDSTAEDGTYNWNCVSESGTDECYAFLSK